MAKTLIAMAVLGCSLAGALPAQTGNGKSGACDRACLEGFVDQYLDAVTAHDPKLAPLAKNVKFTENGQKLEIPDGLWNSMAGKGTYRLFVDDPEAGSVAFIGTIKEEGRTPNEPIAGVIALRLKLQNRQISEVETFVVRNPQTAERLEKIGTPNHLFLEAVPESQRGSRADLIKTANMYFSGMQQNDGKGVYPFTDDCNRIENGMQTTNAPLKDGQARPDPATATNYSSAWGCKEQFQSGLLHFVTRIRDRRYVAVDRERGLVFSFAFFDHSAGKTRHFETPSGRAVVAGPTQPWTWEIAEMFKVENGKLHQIEAVLDRAPYRMMSGWSSPEDGMSDRALDVTMGSR
ncbi:MAG TPA: hypothetical protein VK686_22945 [Bryobacteraceae bacterium]|nr:hypothetical protein [Bryobacteraceae bacterium]